MSTGSLLHCTLMCPHAVYFTVLWYVYTQSTSLYFDVYRQSTSLYFDVYRQSTSLYFDMSTGCLLYCIFICHILYFHTTYDSSLCERPNMRHQLRNNMSTGSLLHELSNDGARQQFNSFLDDLILPQMVSSAQVILKICFMIGQMYGSYGCSLSVLQAAMLWKPQLWAAVFWALLKEICCVDVGWSQAVVASLSSLTSGFCICIQSWWAVWLKWVVLAVCSEDPHSACFLSDCINALKGRGVNWLHFAIQI